MAGSRPTNRHAVRIVSGRTRHRARILLRTRARPSTSTAATHGAPFIHPGAGANRNTIAPFASSGSRRRTRLLHRRTSLAASRTSRRHMGRAMRHRLPVEAVRLLREIEPERRGGAARYVREARRSAVRARRRSATVRDRERTVHDPARLHVDDVPARRGARQAVVHEVQQRLPHFLRKVIAECHQRHPLGTFAAFSIPLRPKSPWSSASIRSWIATARTRRRTRNACFARRPL